MTTLSATKPAPSNTSKSKNDEPRTKSPTTEQHETKAADYTEQSTRARRSNDSHLCITIRGAGPAFGRLIPNSVRQRCRLDLDQATGTILVGSFRC